MSQAYSARGSDVLLRFSGTRTHVNACAAPPADNAKAVSDPQGEVPSPFVYHLSQVKATQLDGGSVKVVDSTTFPVSQAIAVAEVTVEPGAMRYVVRRHIRLSRSELT